MAPWCIRSNPQPAYGGPDFLLKAAFHAIIMLDGKAEADSRGLHDFSEKTAEKRSDMDGAIGNRLEFLRASVIA